jgi:hypothetical protein
MDDFLGSLLREAKEDKKNPDTGKSLLTTGEKLRICDAVTKWIVAKNRLEDIDGAIGIDTLKQRLRGGEPSESSADFGATSARYINPRTIDRGGPEYDRIKRRLPDHGNGGNRGGSGDHSDPDAAPAGARRGVVIGVVDDDGPDDPEADDERRV